MVETWRGIRPECEGGESFRDYDGSWLTVYCTDPARFVVSDDDGYGPVEALACMTCALSGKFGGHSARVRVLTDADLSAYVRGVIDAAFRELDERQLYAIGWGHDDVDPYEGGYPYEAGWNALLAVRVNWLAERE